MRTDNWRTWQVTTITLGQLDIYIYFTEVVVEGTSTSKYTFKFDRMTGVKGPMIYSKKNVNSDDRVAG